MEDDEDSDATITVKDQNGNPLAGKTVRIKEDRAGADAGDDVGAYADFVTDAQGRVIYNINADNLQTEAITISAYVNNDGNPNPTPGDAIATPYVIDADSSVISWDEGVLDQVLVGSTTTFTGKLVQQNTGKPLPNRSIAIDHFVGSGAPGNSILAPQAQQPAGTTRGNDHQAEAVTGNDGSFGVVVTDPTPPDGQELNSFLEARTDPIPTGLDAENDPVGLEIDFLRTLDVTDVEILNWSNGDPDSLWSPYAGNDDLQPGKLGMGYVQAYNADGVLLEDKNVPMSVNEGNFVDTDAPFDPAPVEGNQGGEWSNAGKDITLNTGDGGDTNVFIVNIERHQGFDDNGLVDDEVTAGTGAASFEHDFDWHTMDVPLNSGSFSVELSDDQESSVLPKARAGDPLGVGQLVEYDVVATDQFGNRTGQGINVSDDSPIADFTVNSGRTQYTLEGPAITADSPAAAIQVLEVELNSQTRTVYTNDPYDGSFDPSGVLDLFFFSSFFDTPTADIEQETDAIEWYEVDYDASTFTLGQDGPQMVPVQSAVTEMLTATDQEGQPLKNLVVDFLRGGPGNEDDDSCNEDLLNGCQVTDINGEAFYDFVGGSKGTATITAVVYEPVFEGGERITTVGPDTVQFSGGGQATIVAKLSGKNRGGQDVLKVNAPALADGAAVRLQKKTKNGWKQIGAAKSLNSLGDASFKVDDKNGNQVTKYRAKVSPTTDTEGDTTDVVRQR